MIKALYEYPRKLKTEGKKWKLIYKINNGGFMKSKFIFKNRKIKFREADYIEKHYIRDGKAVIPIKLNSIQELYMKHDYKNLALSDELCNYIEEVAYIIPLKYPITLEIHCPEIPLEEQGRMKSNISIIEEEVKNIVFTATQNNKSSESPQ